MCSPKERFTIYNYKKSSRTEQENISGAETWTQSELLPIMGEGGRGVRANTSESLGDAPV
jgi:hypothetical protein